MLAMKESLSSIHGTVDQVLRLKHVVNNMVSDKIFNADRSAYTPGGANHAPHQGDVIEVPTDNAGE